MVFESSEMSLGDVLAKTQIKTLTGIASKNRAVATFPLNNLAEKFEVDRSVMVKATALANRKSLILDHTELT